MFVTIGLHPLFLHYLFPSFPLVPCSYCVSFVLPFTVASAVIRVVTQRFSPTSGGEALRVGPNNGREGDFYYSRTAGYG